MQPTITQQNQISNLTNSTNNPVVNPTGTTPTSGINSGNGIANSSTNPQQLFQQISQEYNQMGQQFGQLGQVNNWAGGSMGGAPVAPTPINGPLIAPINGPITGSPASPFPANFPFLTNVTNVTPQQGNMPGLNQLSAIQNILNNQNNSPQYAAQNTQGI